MKNFLEFILIHLVDHPEEVKVEEQEEHGQTVFHLSVHPDDMGRVIGKQGSLIQAIRTVAKIRALKEGIRCQIVLVEQPQSSAETA